MNQISVDYFGYISYIDSKGIMTMVPNGFESREFTHNFAFVVGNSTLQEVHNFKVVVKSPPGGSDFKLGDGTFVPKDILDDGIDPYELKNEEDKIFTKREYNS
jgi:hypothetical protein